MKGENKAKLESKEERRARLREKQVIQGEREREREREMKFVRVREREREKREGEERKREREIKEREKGEKQRERERGEIRTRKREIRVNVSAGGQRWPPHLASQGPRFFAACLANAGRWHERLRRPSGTMETMVDIKLTHARDCLARYDAQASIVVSARETRSTLGASPSE